MAARRRRSIRPPELDDPAWLRERYRVAGDEMIATELGVHRNTVRAARARLDIAPHPRGRRARQPRARTRAGLEAAALIAARIADESAPDGRVALEVHPAPTFELIAQRARAVHAARRAGDRRGLEDALVGLGAAAGLVLDGLDRLVLDDSGAHGTLAR